MWGTWRCVTACRIGSASSWLNTFWRSPRQPASRGGAGKRIVAATALADCVAGDLPGRAGGPCRVRPATEGARKAVREVVARSPGPHFSQERVRRKRRFPLRRPPSPPTAVVASRPQLSDGGADFATAIVGQSMPRDRPVLSISPPIATGISAAKTVMPVPVTSRADYPLPPVEPPAEPCAWCGWCTDTPGPASTSASISTCPCPYSASEVGEGPPRSPAFSRSCTVRSASSSSSGRRGRPLPCPESGSPSTAWFDL